MRLIYAADIHGTFERAKALLEEILRPDYAFHIMDCTDLGVVESA